jgi:serine/threonine protein kinase
VTDRPGDRIAGRYEIVELVGTGGTGQVWRCYDTVLDRVVAIKRVRVEDPDDGRRVVHEARMAARVDHPGIVTVYDVLTHQDEPVIVMRFVRGRSLEGVLREEGRLPPGRVATLGLELLDALEATRRAGVVHMDIKPANILFTEHRAMIADWGFAGRVDAATMAEAVGGTPLFMAPERIRDQIASAASDLWSLGVTLYLAVEGAYPFTGNSLFAVADAILHQEPRPARHAGVLGPVLSALLVKDFTRRATGEQTARALRSVG